MGSTESLIYLDMLGIFHRLTSSLRWKKSRKFLFSRQVLAWAKQHQQRLASALAGLIAKQELLEALLAWLQWAETTLTDKDKEVIPQEIEEVKALIAEHQVNRGPSIPSSLRFRLHRCPGCSAQSLGFVTLLPAGSMELGFCPAPPASCPHCP